MSIMVGALRPAVHALLCQRFPPLIVALDLAHEQRVIEHPRRVARRPELLHHLPLDLDLAATRDARRSQSSQRKRCLDISTS